MKKNSVKRKKKIWISCSLIFSGVIAITTICLCVLINKHKKKKELSDIHFNTDLKIFSSEPNTQQVRIRFIKFNNSLLENWNFLTWRIIDIENNQCVIDIFANKNNTKYTGSISLNGTYQVDSVQPSTINEYGFGMNGCSHYISELSNTSLSDHYLVVNKKVDWSQIWNTVEAGFVGMKYDGLECLIWGFFEGASENSKYFIALEHSNHDYLPDRNNPYDLIYHDKYTDSGQKNKDNNWKLIEDDNDYGILQFIGNSNDWKFSPDHIVRYDNVLLNSTSNVYIY